MLGVEVGDLEARREGAEGGIGDDLFDEVGGRGWASVGFGGEPRSWRQVDAGGLEAVEEQAGAAGVEVVAGDAAEDLVDGGLDGRAVFEQGQIEGGAAAATAAGVLDRGAGGVVVVAELLATKTDRAAAAAVGEDVAALEACG